MELFRPAPIIRIGDLKSRGCLTTPILEAFAGVPFDLRCKSCDGDKPGAKTVWQEAEWIRSSSDGVDSEHDGHVGNEGCNYGHHEKPQITEGVSQITNTSNWTCNHETHPDRCEAKIRLKKVTTPRKLTSALSASITLLSSMVEEGTDV